MFIIDEHDACSYTVRTHAHHNISQSSIFFYLPLYSDKENNPEFKETSSPTQPTPEGGG